MKTKEELKKLNSHVTSIFSDKMWWGTNYTISIDGGSGYISLQYMTKEPNVAWACNLHITDLARKQGLGTILLNTCIEMAKASNTPFLKLYVDKTKDWLVKWYQKYGFVITCIEEHEFEMTKIITKER